MEKTANHKTLQRLFVRDLKSHLARTRISPEQLAKQVSLSHMTIRRWLQKRDGEALPRKYNPLLGPVFSGVPVQNPPPFTLTSALGSNGIEDLMRQVEKSGENFKNLPGLERDLEVKLRAFRFDKIFIDSCQRLLSNIKSSKTPLRAKAICVGALIYFISPIDLIPDNIPVFGYLDDLAVLSLALDFAGRSKSDRTTRS